MTKEHKGVIYILTNPSFKDYVKIGYAHDIEKRLRQLNRSETIPFAFRVYAIYEVQSELTDMELHKLIDNLNPDLRTIETFDGKKRVKEFYAMSPEDAYSILESIAKISGTTACLKRLTPEGHEVIDEAIAKEVQENAKRGPFRFSLCGIKPGEYVVINGNHPGIRGKRILYHAGQFRNDVRFIFPSKPVQFRTEIRIVNRPLVPLDIQCDFDRLPHRFKPGIHAGNLHCIPVDYPRF